jgi:myo-inositol-1(or 4)-monophosphatase
VTPDALLELFDEAAAAQGRALAEVQGTDRRGRTDRVGQYALDLVADAAVTAVLERGGVRIVSEESGLGGAAQAAVTVVVDPVDGSTNCARHIPYWAISLCALDEHGPLCALVVNGATGTRFAAVRGRGATVDGAPLAAASTTTIEQSVIAVSGLPPHLPWKQFRALGSCALTLCEIGAGRLDAFVDCLSGQHAPWDYLGGLLVCREAGAVVEDLDGRELVTDDPSARRRLVAAATPELLGALRDAMSAPTEAG